MDNPVSAVARRRFSVNVPVVVITILLASAGLSAVSADESASPGSRISIRPSVELGFIDIPFHQIQFGEGTDRFDYVTQGGQEILFPYQRLRVDVGVGSRQQHQFGLLYQPLTIETVTQMERQLTIDTETFDVGQVVDLVYSFDFWRVTYAYRFLDAGPWEAEAGLSFQIRNASIQFRSQNTDELVISQNTGPVPVVRVRSRYTFPRGPFVEAEADGFYASSAFINGAEYPFTGYIWDAAISAGTPIHPAAEAYITVRTIGGGATGTATDERDVWTESIAGGNERFTDNALATVAASLGFRLRF